MMWIKNTLLGLISLFVCLFFVPSANAADPELQIDIQYTTDPDSIPVAEYRFYIERVPGSGTPEIVGSWPTVETGDLTWSGVFYDIPMGKTLNWYVDAVDSEGDATALSPAFPFKLTGKAVIINIRRIK